jgi:hypothetical protein
MGYSTEAYICRHCTQFNEPSGQYKPAAMALYHVGEVLREIWRWIIALAHGSHLGA